MQCFIRVVWQHFLHEAQHASHALLSEQLVLEFEFQLAELNWIGGSAPSRVLSVQREACMQTILTYII